MNKGTISCDKCKKEIAKIKASVQYFAVFETEPFTEITCTGCIEEEQKHSNSSNPNT